MEGCQECGNLTEVQVQNGRGLHRGGKSWRVCHIPIAWAELEVIRPPPSPLIFYGKSAMVDLLPSAEKTKRLVLVSMASE